jgi:hypothetical protein
LLHLLHEIPLVIDGALIGTLYRLFRPDSAWLRTARDL